MATDRLRPFQSTCIICLSHAITPYWKLASSPRKQQILSLYFTPCIRCILLNPNKTCWTWLN